MRNKSPCAIPPFIVIGVGHCGPEIAQTIGGRAWYPNLGCQTSDKANFMPFNL